MILPDRHAISPASLAADKAAAHYLALVRERAPQQQLREAKAAWRVLVHDIAYPPFARHYRTTDRASGIQETL
ncbi:hypothetical protein EHF33_20490 (plasmid) [Deinococcus psychrotolerans]|uniref:Uncharacterized protein n=1 Tax=Deinococcus psychrotolerans TaxID=2489213 RepID=A0A3G8YKT5_9DEIO|nr:hypothetical protein EHF33_20490 [Deinococcus psychrotolerans]